MKKEAIYLPYPLFIPSSSEMLTYSKATQLRDLAYVYLVLAHGADDCLSNAELDAITNRLCVRWTDYDAISIREIVNEMLAVYMDDASPLETAARAMMALRSSLTPEQCQDTLQDLIAVAKADGVIMDTERGLLAGLAECWGIPLSEEALSAPRFAGHKNPPSWGFLHHLAFLYLVLAHGTDNELSEREISVMHARLKEWQRDLSEEQIRSVFASAMNRYSQGPDEAALSASIHAVKASLPETKRMAALHDLVQIANADGFFLDDEEDLINRLMTAWELSPYANYRDQVSKE